MSAEHTINWELYYPIEFGNLPRNPYQSPARVIDQAEDITLQAALIDSIGMSEMSQLTKVRVLARRAIRNRFPELPAQLLGNPPRRPRMHDYDQFRKRA